MTSVSTVQEYPPPLGGAFSSHLLSSGDSLRLPDGFSHDGHPARQLYHTVGEAPNHEYIVREVENGHQRLDHFPPGPAGFDLSQEQLVDNLERRINRANYSQPRERLGDGRLLQNIAITTVSGDDIFPQHSTGYATSAGSNNVPNIATRMTGGAHGSLTSTNISRSYASSSATEAGSSHTENSSASPSSEGTPMLPVKRPRSPSDQHQSRTKKGAKRPRLHIHQLEVGSKPRNPRQPFKDEERRQTGHTRRLGACVRCRAQKIRVRIIPTSKIAYVHINLVLD